MSEIKRLKDEVTELRSLVYALERNVPTPSNPRLVKIGKRVSSDEVSGVFSDFHAVDANYDRRTKLPSITAQKLDEDHFILVCNQGQWFYQGCCGGSVAEPTECLNVQGSLLPALLTLDMTGVEYTNGQNRTGWTAAAEAIINSGFALGSNPQTGYESSVGSQIDPPATLTTSDCARAAVNYYSMPEIANPPIPTRPYNAMRVFIEATAGSGFFTGIQWFWYVVIKINFGHMVGDPKNDEPDEAFYFNSGAGSHLFQQWVNFQSTPTILKNSVTSDTIVAPVSEFWSVPTDPDNFDFAAGLAVTEVQPGPFPAPPNASTVDTVANLPLVSAYSLGDTVTVYNDGANNGVYVATGAAHPPTAWVKS